MAKKQKKKKGKIKKPKRKLTAAEKREKKRQRELYETIFINGKQKRVRRSPPIIDYSQIDDPIFFTQNEMWEELYAWEQRRDASEAQEGINDGGRVKDNEDDIPF